MNSSKSQLWEAYRNTAFQAFTPARTVTIRIGMWSGEVDELLRSRDATEWSFITAYNPASEALSAELNQRRHAELEADVQERGLTYLQGQGIGSDTAWQPEVSLLILGLARDAAIELGAKYGQNAIVYGKSGQAAVLVDCR